MKKLLGVLAASVLIAISANANAEFDQTKLYIGGGLGYNDIDSAFSSVDNAIGFQGFVGYSLEDLVELAEGIRLAGEVGYMTTGDFDYDNDFCSSCKIDAATGLWATAVIDYAINEQFEVLGRLGMDFGDDDGLMYGAGAGFNINEQVSIRAEYVIRDNINSLQANGVYRFK